MKIRIVFAASLVFAAVAPASALAQAPTKAHVRAYEHAYHAVAHKFGHRAPGRNIVKWGLSSGKKATDEEVVTSLGTLRNMLAPAPVVRVAPTTPSSTQTSYTAPTATYTAPVASGGGYGSVPGVPGSFAACVALRESTNGAGSSNIYGILPSNGYYPGMSVAQQKQLFSSMYSHQGAAPWAPYDGC